MTHALVRPCVFHWIVNRLVDALYVRNWDGSIFGTLPNCYPCPSLCSSTGRQDDLTVRQSDQYKGYPPTQPTPRGCSCTGRCISVPRRLYSQYVVLVAFPCACPQILSCRAALRDTSALSVAAPAIAYFVTGGINVSCKTSRPLYVGGHLWCCITYWYIVLDRPAFKQHRTVYTVMN
jgi:hypothetical protein